MRHPYLPQEIAPRPAVPIPVLEISATSLNRWARVVTGTDAVAGVPLLDAEASGERPPMPGEGAVGQVVAEPYGSDVLRAFRAEASPEAYRLAGFLAAISPLTLPVMRTVQDTLPGATRTHLAEVFLGGLLRRDGDSGAFFFRDDVRSLFLDTLDPEETLALVESVGRRIEAWWGRGPEASALLGAADGAVSLPPGARPYAVTAAPLLERIAADAMVEGFDAETEAESQLFNVSTEAASPFDWSLPEYVVDALAVQARRSYRTDLPSGRFALRDADLFAKADEFLLRNAYDHAANLFEALLQGEAVDQQTQVIGYWGLGQVAKARGNLPAALDAFRTASSIQSESAEAYHGESRAIQAEILVAVAYCLLDLGQDAQAIIYAREAVGYFAELVREPLRYNADLMPREPLRYRSEFVRALTALGDCQLPHRREAAGDTYRQALGMAPTRAERYTLAKKVAELGYDHAATSLPEGARPIAQSLVRVEAEEPTVPLEQGDTWQLSRTQLTGTFRVSLDRSDAALLRPRSRRFQVFPDSADIIPGDPSHVALGCLYLLADGTRGAVQDLAGRDGDYGRQPHIWIDSFSQLGDRELYIDLSQQFRAILVYAVARFGEFDRVRANVTFVANDGIARGLRLERHGLGLDICAVAMLSWTGDQCTLRADARFVGGGEHGLDEAYRWGLRWPEGVAVKLSEGS